jgi:magnesium-transporting ATPase (P-type)
LATESPHEGLLDRAPARKKEFMVNSKMQKHVLGQSVYQLIILFIILYAGPGFIKETNPDMIRYGWGLNYCFNAPVTISPQFPQTTSPNPDLYLQNNQPDVFLISGLVIKFAKDSGLDPNANATWCNNMFASSGKMQDAYSYVGTQMYATTHYSIIFNMFVVMQLFNQICCRIIDDNYNIFFRITTNWMFFFILIIEAALQVIIVEVTGPVFKIVAGGLGGVHWGICIGFAAITFLVNIILKLCPDFSFGSDEEKSHEMPVESSMAGNIKGNSKIKQSSLPGGPNANRRSSLRKDGSKQIHPKDPVAKDMKEEVKQPSMKGGHVALNAGAGAGNQA